MTGLEFMLDCDHVVDREVQTSHAEHIPPASGVSWVVDRRRGAVYVEAVLVGKTE